MEITFLGTSTWMPTKKRNHSAILLTYEGENILVDCGEGTQRQFQKADMSITKITRLLITHWHGDHVLGIPGLLQSLALHNYTKTLYIYGPKGTKKFIKELQDVFQIKEGKISIKVEEVSGKFLETKDFYLEAESMTHGIPCNAYRFVKKEQLRIDRNKLKKYKIPSIPLLLNLKQGKDITYNGKKYTAKSLTYLQEAFKISFVLDTSFNSKIIPFVKDSNLLIAEASFSNEDKEKAKEHNHLTAKQSAEIAKKSKSKKLILTHVGQRYEHDFSIILKEAQKVFKNTSIANDLDVMKI